MMNFYFFLYMHTIINRELFFFPYQYLLHSRQIYQT